MASNLLTEQEVHLGYLQEALREAQKCDPVLSAFCVGCILVTHWPHLNSPGVILAKGHSRELAGNTHAEANALTKARSLSKEDISVLVGAPPPSIDELLRNADAYTTMEPCSIRTSGLAPCADALIFAKIRKCLIGVAEPDDFVACEGAQRLKDAGVEVHWIKGMEQECLSEARRGRS